MKKKWTWLGICILVLALCAGCGATADKTVSKATEPVRAVREEVPREVPQGVSVLMYHMIADIEDNGAVLKPENFRAQMRYLKEHNYHPITLDELYAYVEKGAPLPVNPVCITFDDGYEDNYSIVYPIMKEYGFPWTVFIIGGMTGEPGRLTWEQLKEMHANGVTIANHTMTHRQIPYLDPATQKQEVAETQRLLKEKLGIDNHYFCYPYGLYSDTLEKILREEGIHLAVTMDPGRTHQGDRLLEIKRIWIGNPVDLEHFAERLTVDNYRSL